MSVATHMQQGPMAAAGAASVAPRCHGNHPYSWSPAVDTRIAPIGVFTGTKLRTRRPKEAST